MRRMISAVLFIVRFILFGETLEVIDYSNDSFALVPDGETYLFSDIGTLYHVSNVTLFVEKFYKYRAIYEKSNSQMMEDEKERIFYSLNECEATLHQLARVRVKRGLCDLCGHLYKILWGLPDRDEINELAAKINNSIENNKILDANNKILQDFFNATKTRSQVARLETSVEILRSALIKLIDTINNGLNLNTPILSANEIKEIIGAAKNRDALLIDILHHSMFKLILIDSVYVVVLKYPLLNRKCAMYNVMAIEQKFGKLQLEKSVAKCDDEFVTIRNCKKHLSGSICEYNEQYTCVETMLNGVRANCTIIREHMRSIDEINFGKILINGNHTVNNMSMQGTYMLLFNESILIDNKNYTNDRELVFKYLKEQGPVDYAIVDISEGEDDKLKFNRTDIIMTDPLPSNYIDDVHPIKKFAAIICIMIFLICLLVLIHKCCNVLTKCCECFN